MSIMMDTGSGGRMEMALFRHQAFACQKQSILFWHVTYWLLSAIDLFLTIASFRIGGLEMNPIADWFYAHFGIGALVTYKVIMVILITMEIAYIGKHKPQWAKRIYMFGFSTLIIASSLSLSQIIWFIHEFSWDIFLAAFRYAL